MQTIRSKNPYLHNLPTVINVEVPEGSKFTHTELLRDQYELDCLAGQHISTADIELLESVFAKTSDDKIPTQIKYKQTEIYVNLTSDEKAFIVNVQNEHISYDAVWFDKVRNIDLL